MSHFESLRPALSYLNDGQIDQIHKAYEFAASAHQHQKRISGEPYITHPVAVAQILAEMVMDAETIMAAILHDVIEDTKFSYHDIADNFGEKVAELVDGVSKLTQIEVGSIEEQQAENFRKMMLAMSKDVRVILIKLADRLHNMRTLGSLRLEKKRRIAKETLEIYAPIAARLGMNHLRIEFEDLGFKHLHPLRYRVLEEALIRARGSRESITNSIESSLTEAFEQQKITVSAIAGREKHLFSLYQKMKSKSLSFSKVMDIYAFRIITHSIADCYSVLGVVHSTFKPMMGRFKDYIATPKPNGYQSLHTVVMGPYGVPIEIQIRTEEMDKTAQSGIAAHWLYKNEDFEAQTEHLRTRAWVKGLLDIQKNTGSSLEFIENVKFDLYSNEVYVFTPQGRILALPEGASAIDFAYAVHTDIGNSCVASKIDRVLQPLSTRLSSGQTVEIITDKNATPNPSWMSFAVTGKARSNIRHWLKTQKRSAAIELGSRFLENALSDAGRHLSDINAKTLQAVLAKHGMKTVEDLFESIGMGRLVAPLIAEQILADISDDEITSSAYAISGTEGLAVTYASCCHPIPGDPIVGVLKVGEGIFVHHESCERLNTNGNLGRRVVHLTWQEGLDAEFAAHLRVDVLNGRGVLATLAGAIAESDANIQNVTVDKRDSHHNSISFLVMVKNRTHLARIMRRMRRLSSVTKLTRVIN